MTDSTVASAIIHHLTENIATYDQQRMIGERANYKLYMRCASCRTQMSIKSEELVFSHSN